MRIIRLFILLLISTGCMTSCISDATRAKELVTTFYSAATDSISGLKVIDYYPMFDSLHVSIKCDVLDLDDDVIEKNDTLIVSGQNSYTDTNGVFKQDSIKFYIAKDKLKEYKIVNSQGIILMPDYLKDFAKQIGLKKQNLKDLDQVKLNEMLQDFYSDKCIDAIFELYTGVKISYWDWKTDYSNEPQGQAWIINNTNITIKNIKYIVSYYDGSHNYISDDTGTACSKLSPGEKYRFTFYTSHVKSPSSANLKLDFASSNVDAIISSKGYTEEDFINYCNYIN